MRTQRRSHAAQHSRTAQHGRTAQQGRTGQNGRTGQQRVDYSLARRGLLREVYAGRVGTYEVCDASPYLLAAARYHGDPTQDRCPLCRREHLVRVHYVYGDESHPASGQARRREQLAPLASSVHAVRVYGVEVCPGCGWNYLMEQFVLGGAPGDAAVPGAASLDRVSP